MKHAFKSHRTPLLLLLAIISLATAGCGWQSNTGDLVPINVADFYQPNHSWTYREVGNGADATYTVKVMSATQYHGTNALRVDSFGANSTQQVRQYIAFSAAKGTILGTEIVDTATNNTIDNPVLPGVSFQSVLALGNAIVSKYETTEPDGKIQWTVKSEILSVTRETVAVPAGVYRQAVKVHSRVTTTRAAVTSQSSDTSVLEEYTWYSPQIGMVKGQTVDGTRVTELLQST